MLIKLRCKFCKKIYLVKAYRKSKSSFCSYKCKGRFQKTSMRGKNNPMYGISLINPRKNKTLEEYHGLEEASAMRKRVSEGTKIGMSTKKARKNFIRGMKKRKMPEGHYHRLGMMCVGRKHSPETRKKISMGNMGKTLSLKIRKHIGEINRLHWIEGRYAHIDFSKSWLGRKHKVESKELIRSKLRKFWSNKNNRKRTIFKILTTRRKNLEKFGSKTWTSKIERRFFRQLKKRVSGLKTQFNFFNQITVDGAIPSKKIVIEFFGDYWHVNPIKFPNPTNKQISFIIRDRNRMEKILSHKWQFIRIWEYDFRHNPELVLSQLEKKLNND